MSTDKVTQQHNEEEAEIDLGIEEEEEVHLPYSWEYATNEQVLINNLTQKVADLTKENKRLRKELEQANRCSMEDSIKAEERWQENYILKKKQKKLVTGIEALFKAFNEPEELTIEGLKKDFLKKARNFE